MVSVSENNKRIAKNTLLLYVRMFITMAISLYTSRIVLKTLGVDDFGIYNIVGSVIAAFSFISGPLGTATQRFYNFELGRNNCNGVNNIYNHTIYIYAVLSIILLIIIGISGNWFINYKMNLPVERVYAAKWAFHFSLLSFILSLFKMPHEALIIANEKMSFYAYVSILDVVLKLFFVFSLVFISIDKLIIYSLGLLLIIFANLFIVIVYCYRKFDYIRIRRMWDRQTFKLLLGFSGWSLFGSLATMSQNQGLNILLNVFFGVVVNAAMGIATQVSSAINQFVSNFQIAYRPQIVKNYAAGNLDALKSLISNSSKFSYLLLFALVCPITFNIDTILKLWLGTVPEHASIFCICMLIYALLETLSAPMWMTVQATGRIRNYQIIISSVIGLNIIISYIFLKFGFPPETVLIIKCCLDLGYLAIRLIFIRNMVGFSIRRYIVDVILPIVVISVICLVIMYLINIFIHESPIHLITKFLLFGITYLSVIYFIGFKKNEKKYILSYITSLVNRFYTKKK